MEMETQTQTIQQSQHISPSQNWQVRGSEQLDEPGKFELIIKLSEHYRYITDIWIFDSSSALIVAPNEEQRYDSVRGYKLSPGEFIVRVENNGQICDNIIKLDQDLTVTVGEKNLPFRKLRLPQLYSSAPISGPIAYASSDHEYIVAAERISNECIGLDDADSGNSGIFFFFRYPSVSLYQENYAKSTYWKRFELLDESGKLLLSFPEHCDVSDEKGYLGVCLSLKKGNYYLQYKKRNHSRMVPIFVYENWYTQFFMTLVNEPLFGSIRYFINAASNFDSADIRNSYVDICLDKLQNNDFTIDPNLLRNISYGKFESPMLGLVGAFLYFSSKETKEDYLFRLILENLQTRILHNQGESPDIMALKILAMEHFGESVKIEKYPNYSSTPMLRIAFDIIRRNGNKFPWLIREGSIDDFIIEKQVFDSPINTFRPLRAATLKRASIEEERFHDPFDRNEKRYIEYFEIPRLKPIDQELEMLEEGKAYDQSKGQKAKREPEPMTQFSAFKKHGQAGSAIFGLLSENPEKSTSEIAYGLNLPEVTVERIRRGLKL